MPLVLRKTITIPGNQPKCFKRKLCNDFFNPQFNADHWYITEEKKIKKSSQEYYKYITPLLKSLPCMYTVLQSAGIALYNNSLVI